MKLLIDFFPLLAFFGAYKAFDIYTASAVLMAATVLQMGTIYALERTLALQYKVTLVLVLVFGTLTLVLQDENFIKWKPTVLYAAFALGLALATWGFRKNVVQLLLGQQIPLPDAVWCRLNQIWMAYTLGMAALNAYVVLNYSTDDWVNFKLWGYVFPLIFIVVQGIYIAPHLKEPEESKGSTP